ncbi:Ankyrin repeat [Fusarium oxysporum f. sp. vasinfectum]|uniref:Uncharacterized protein n=1 Tax=Fusarium oxysporum f. sp. vasinfectum 25433 TaxID=1089449 RepID=X0KG14_FUSOX|nr:hypothetical protein FOTG_18957 [Fusarium oxysporum f. sp. vasinfectum 25433]KAK2666796.1 Ankyrin repeat [Fusarium oxysporum f. sp. vasinfectum]KAK2922872.1 Ankyrin repeat [Fusarium oxysporum f. sp. vasinfectum]
MLLDICPELLLKIASFAGDRSLAKLSECRPSCHKFFKPYLYSRHVQLKSYKPIERAVVYYSKEAPIISVFKAYMEAGGDIRQKMKVEEGYPPALLEAVEVTALDVASARGHLDVVNFLLEQNYFQVGESIETLLYSLRAGQPKTSKLLIDKGADIWSATAGSALHAAAQGGLPAMVRFLVDEKKQDPNEYHEGYTALHKAIVSAQKSGDEKRFLPTIVALLERGAEIDMITQTGHYGVNVHQDRPLTLACDLGLFEIATLLLKKGAYPCMNTIIDSKAVLASLQDCYMLKNRDNDAVVDFITELTVRARDPDLVHPETGPDVVIPCSFEVFMAHMVYCPTNSGFFKVTYALLCAEVGVPDLVRQALRDRAEIRCRLVDLKLAFIWLPYLGDDQITDTDRRLIWHIRHEIEDIRTLFDSQDNEEVILSGSCPPSDVRQILQEWKKDVNYFFNED